MSDLRQLISHLRFAAPYANRGLAAVMLEAADELEIMANTQAILIARNDSQQRQFLDLVVRIPDI